jgi:hypothetical protein
MICWTHVDLRDLGQVLRPGKNLSTAPCDVLLLNL